MLMTSEIFGLLTRRKREKKTTYVHQVEKNFQVGDEKKGA